MECLDHSIHIFYVYSCLSMYSIGLLVLCGLWVLISMAPTHIDHHASYHSPLHLLRCVYLRRRVKSYVCWYRIRKLSVKRHAQETEAELILVQGSCHSATTQFPTERFEPGGPESGQLDAD